VDPYRAENTDSGERAIVRMLERLRRADRRVQLVGTALVFLGAVVAGALIGMMLKGWP
jgi:hypothetical protein